jgi:tetratricopeptide (TPR) repeat protein
LQAAPASRWLWGLLLLCGVIVAYVPALRGGFVWDDDVYVTHNVLLTAPDGLWRIWFSLDSPSQYFPLVYTSFYFERMLWGLQAAGYHAVNVVLHAANALLLWRLLLRLRIPGAWIGAAIFALHPVQVESVAWITERKNVLMGLFFLLSLRAWVEFIDEKKPNRWWYYAMALMSYALALAAKTTACTLPATLLLILWLKRTPVGWRRIGQVLPFALLGAGMGLVTVWWERFHQGTRGEYFSIGPMERLLIACRAIWFYIGKFLWPARLTFSYPQWTVSVSEATAWFWLFLTVAVGAAIWFARGGFRKSFAIAAVFYVTTLAPVLGFIMLYTFRYTFVADHYQYLACIGPAALAGAGVAAAVEYWPGQRRIISAVTMIILLTLGMLTWKQAGIYHSGDLLWRDTLAKNPACWLAWNNVGLDLLEKGQLDDAIKSFDKSLAINRHDPEASYNLGNAYLQKGNLEAAIAQYRRALDLNPNLTEAQSNLGNTLFQTGQTAEAIAHWQRAVELEPSNAAALNNLAWVLATCPTDSLRDGPRAVALAQQADQLTGGANPRVLRTLAAAYAETGKFADAVKTAQTALQLAATQGDAALSHDLESQVKLHQAGLPMHGGSKMKP